MAKERNQTVQDIIAKEDQIDSALEKITERIETLNRQYNAKLSDLDEGIRKASEENEADRQRMEDAAASIDLQSFSAAKEKSITSENMLEMLRTKRAQVVNAGKVTLEESDAQIDEIKAIEADLAEDFKKRVAVELQKLVEICNNYSDKVQTAEDLITRWTSEIHANYRMEIRQELDHETGGYTNISKTPVSVRSIPYRGCTEYVIMIRFLRDKAPRLLPDSVRLKNPLGN